MVAGYVDFQIRHAEFPLLVVGTGANPTGFQGPDVVHLDLDIWNVPRFVQGDAHALPFRSGSFRSCLLGDVLEHVLDPVQVLRECGRVAKRTVCTVFEEWRIGPPGQHLEAGHALYAPVESHYQPFRDSGQCRVRYSEDRLSHSPHIWAFTLPMLQGMIAEAGLRVLHLETDCPGVHDGHAMNNWLFVLEGTS